MAFFMVAGSTPSGTSGCTSARRQRVGEEGRCGWEAGRQADRQAVAHSHGQAKGGPRCPWHGFCPTHATAHASAAIKRTVQCLPACTCVHANGQPCIGALRDCSHFGPPRQALVLPPAAQGSKHTVLRKRWRARRQQEDSVELAKGSEPRNIYNSCRFNSPAAAPTVPVAAFTPT